MSVESSGFGLFGCEVGRFVLVVVEIDVIEDVLLGRLFL